MLTSRDLSAIRAIVREEIERALRVTPATQGANGENAGENADEDADEDDLIREHAHATLAFMREEPGSDVRLHAIEVARVTRYLEEATDPKDRRRYELWLARLERRGPHPFPSKRPKTPRKPRQA